MNRGFKNEFDTQSMELLVKSYTCCFDNVEEVLKIIDEKSLQEEKKEGMNQKVTQTVRILDELKFLLNPINDFSRTLCEANDVSIQLLNQFSLMKERKVMFAVYECLLPIVEWINSFSNKEFK